MNRPALLVIDLQYDFLDVRLGRVGRANKAICLPGVRNLLAFGRTEGWRVIHILTRHLDGTTLPARLRTTGVQPFCVQRTEGELPVSGLKHPDDEVLYKTGFSGFGGTDLAEKLSGVDDLVVAGVAADCCVLSTALDASGNHGKNVYVPYQAVSTSREDGYYFGLEAIGKSAGAILDLEQVMNKPGVRLDDVPEVTLAKSWMARAWYEAKAGQVESARQEYERLLREGDFNAGLWVLEEALQ